MIAQEGSEQGILLLDSTKVDSNDFRYLHPPKRATIMSALLPGAGQVYNKQAWKVPIIYAGLGTTIYFAQKNNQLYREFRQSWLAVVDDDPSTVNLTDSLAEDLGELTLSFRKKRDWAFIATGGVYLLQILDANVSAHLFHFDVSDDLSLRWYPTVIDPRAGMGLGIQLIF